MVAGPTTLVSLLVSLRVGFRCLAIQKHSNEVWKVLGAVKTEFGKFGGIIDKVSKKLQETQNVIDVEVGVAAEQWIANCKVSSYCRKSRQSQFWNSMAQRNPPSRKLSDTQPNKSRTVIDPMALFSIPSDGMLICGEVLAKNI